MDSKGIERRDFLKYVLGGISVLALDWSSLPRRVSAFSKADEYDAIIIGSGLGGLSRAAGFARQGFKVLVLEQHDKPGGFVFDVSLHSTGAGERDGLHNLIPGFPEIRDVEFVPHPNLYRAIYPDYDVRVPQKDLRQYIRMLTGYFPEEKKGIEGIFQDMQALTDDIYRFRKYSINRGTIWKRHTGRRRNRI